MAIISEFLARLAIAQREDERIKNIVIDDKTFTSIGGIIYEVADGQNLLLIPNRMQTEVIRSVHNIGHFRIAKTKELIKKDYSINNLENKITEVISHCVPCILVNRKQGKQEGFLQNIDKGDTPLAMWQVDFLGPLTPTPKGYKHIFAVIDGFTKFCWLFPTKSVTADEVIDRLTLLETTFGNPKKSVSDRGSAFTSESFRQYCLQRDIHHVLITTGVLRANGQVERLNSVIINVLAKLSLDKPENWYHQVPRLQMALNSSYQRAIGMTPFKQILA